MNAVIQRKINFDRMDRLSEIAVSMCERVIREQQSTDELAKRRQLRRACVQLVVVKKMYARVLEDIYDSYAFEKRKIQRARMLRNDEQYLHEHYNSLNSACINLQKLRQSNGEWMMTMGDWLKKLRVQFTDTELKAALSIPESDWKSHVGRKNERDIPQLAFVAKLGDESLVNQICYAMVKAFTSASQKTRDRVRWKMQSQGLWPI